MADYGLYSDSAESNKPQLPDNWKSIGDLARRLVENAK